MQGENPYRMRGLTKICLQIARTFYLRDIHVEKMKDYK